MKRLANLLENWNLVYTKTVTNQQTRLWVIKKKVKSSFYRIFVVLKKKRINKMNHFFFIEGKAPLMDAYDKRGYTLMASELETDEQDASRNHSLNTKTHQNNCE
mmetsp:Transcript_8763/g.12977  ORF Transcript_8763/g.12977 Transcript_8763/m.12977 type:complete len:104 (+) Transcript_8763:720-1031(+)